MKSAPKPAKAAVNGTIVAQTLERALRPGEVSLDELERAFRETAAEAAPAPAPKAAAPKAEAAKAEKAKPARAGRCCSARWSWPRSPRRWPRAAW